MSWNQGTKRWFWRAWTPGRERIADCGWLTAETAEAARANAKALLGGPHRHLVVEIQIEEIP